MSSACRRATAARAELWQGQPAAPVERTAPLLAARAPALRIPLLQGGLLTADVKWNFTSEQTHGVFQAVAWVW